jgi:hypothetical protein
MRVGKGQALALAAQGGSAHLELEPARFGRVADCADGYTDYLPQDVAAQYGKATAMDDRRVIAHTN